MVFTRLAVVRNLSQFKKMYLSANLAIDVWLWWLFALNGGWINVQRSHTGEFKKDAKLTRGLVPFFVIAAHSLPVSPRFVFACFQIKLAVNPRHDFSVHFPPVLRQEIAWVESPGYMGHAEPIHETKGNSPPELPEETDDG